MSAAPTCCPSMAIEVLCSERLLRWFTFCVTTSVTAWLRWRASCDEVSSAPPGSHPPGRPRSHTIVCSADTLLQIQSSATITNTKNIRLLPLNQNRMYQQCWPNTQTYQRFWFGIHNASLLFPDLVLSAMIVMMCNTCKLLSFENLCQYNFEHVCLDIVFSFHWSTRVAPNQLMLFYAH